LHIENSHIQQKGDSPRPRSVSHLKLIVGFRENFAPLALDYPFGSLSACEMETLKRGKRGNKIRRCIQASTKKASGERKSAKEGGALGRLTERRS
jgi:hypothetical protein